MQTIQEIHERAVAKAKRYHEAEGELLEALIQVIQRKVYLEMGYANLFAYATGALKLAEGQAYHFIGVARKSMEVPELKQAIERGSLNVSRARRILSVLTPQNKESWIGKAELLPQKQLEIEVAKENPKKEIRERIRPVAEERLEMRIGISPKLSGKLSRVKDLLSQKKKKACTLEEAVEAMTELFLDREDPVRKAERVLSSRRKETIRERAQVAEKVAAPPPFAKSRRRAPLPAEIQHAVNLRDQGQCRFVDPSGRRCQQRRWLHAHHIKPVASGGNDESSNLATLCAAHHRFLHSQVGFPLNRFCCIGGHEWSEGIAAD